jgi:hypothetical protein
MRQYNCAEGSQQFYQAPPPKEGYIQFVQTCCLAGHVRNPDEWSFLYSSNDAATVRIMSSPEATDARPRRPCHSAKTAIHASSSLGHVPRQSRSGANDEVSGGNWDGLGSGFEHVWKYFLWQVGIYGGGPPEMDPLSVRTFKNVVGFFRLVSSRGFCDVK